VADLSASGLTNRQVAEALFMSPKTVEWNLAKIYRKLGVSSRAQLASKFHADQVQETATPNR
jgi:DNA-binding CsgD family transcriptional regulator